jgi:hypothetical protein
MTAMADTSRQPAAWTRGEVEREQRARRQEVRENAAKGVGRNLEEALRLMRFGEAFHRAFRRHRR